VTEDWLARFRHYGAVQDGHFLLTSGLHSSTYVQSALILQYPDEAEALGRALAGRLRSGGVEGVDVVIGPALGGIIVAHEVGRALGCRALFAERSDGQMKLRRGFTISLGERALVVEDVITTGGSVGEVAALVRQAGGVVAGFGALVDRSAGRASLDAPVTSLITLVLPTYRPETCPLCRAGEPIRKPGSRGAPLSPRPTYR